MKQSRVFFFQAVEKAPFFIVIGMQILSELTSLLEEKGKIQTVNFFSAILGAVVQSWCHEEITTDKLKLCFGMRLSCLNH